jgi:hypothetical protein
VIVAEDITSRFLNVISLFNGFIPIVAVQMQAFRFGDSISLVFTTVLSEMRLGLVDDDEAVADVTDRSYWEKRASKQTLAITDSLFGIISGFAPGISLKYNKFYIGLAKDGQPNNFAIFRPKKDWVWFEPKLDKDEATQAKLDEAGLDVVEYDSRGGRYRIRIGKNDLSKHEALVTELLKLSYGETGE